MRIKELLVIPISSGAADSSGLKNRKPQRDPLLIGVRLSQTGEEFSRFLIIIDHATDPDEVLQELSISEA